MVTQCIPVQECSVEGMDRCMAIQKLISVRNFAHQDSDPCWVLEGLDLGAALPTNISAWPL